MCGRSHRVRRVYVHTAWGDCPLAWDILERLWGQTVARALRLAPELPHEPVDGERSFTGEAARLVFAPDAWFKRVILGDRSPWQPLDLLRGEMPTRLGVRPLGPVGRRQDQPGLGSHRAPK